MLLELHEHEIPDLDEPLVVSVGRTTIVSERRALVPEDFRARAARAGVGHPPVVVLVETLDPLGGDTHLVTPDGLRLVVTYVHGDPESLGIQAQNIGHELPGEGAGLRLEVVAEAEVSHHLEEGEMPTGASHLVEVVVLAAGPYALLDGDRPVPRRRLLAHEVRLERHHPGHREQQRRVVGDQAPGCLVMVAVLDEEVDEGPAEAGGGEQGLGSGRHGQPSLGKPPVIGGTSEVLAPDERLSVRRASTG